MDEIFTRLISFSEIDTSETDLVADAFGLDAAADSLLPLFGIEPEQDIVTDLLEKIKQGTRVC